VATAGSSSEVRSFVLLNFAFLSNLLSPAYQAFQVPEKSSEIPVVNPRFVDAARGRNLQVHIWTVNHEEDMQRFIEMGVDGIMTDRPDLLLQKLGRPHYRTKTRGMNTASRIHPPQRVPPAKSSWPTRKHFAAGPTELNRRIHSSR
jgi:hypothetical protein